MATVPSIADPIELTFGETRLQISLDPDASIEALASEVEEKLNLHPGSYGVFDAFGKVSTSTALRRARMSTDGDCTFEIREAPEWQTIRQMDAKIQMLVARCPVVDDILMSIEKRSAERFAKTCHALQFIEKQQGAANDGQVSADVLSLLQELDAKVNNSIAPMLQSMAVQQMDKAKLEEDLDAKVNNSIAPLLQSMAVEQMDLKAKLEDARVLSLFEEMDTRISKSVALHQIELEAKLGKKNLEMYSNIHGMLQNSLKEAQETLTELRSSCSVKVEDVEQSAINLQKAMGAQDEKVQEICKQVKGLQDEMRCHTNQSSVVSDSRMPLSSAMFKDLVKAPKTPSHAIEDGEGNFPFHRWLETSPLDQISSLSYSKKPHMALNDNGFIMASAAGVPFARFNAHSQRGVRSSRSQPVLPPVT